MSDVRLSASRRQFLVTSAASLAFATTAARFGHAAPSISSPAETIISEFYQGLSEQQKSAICFDIANPAVKKAHANWHISDPLIGSDFYNKSQQAAIEKIVRSVTSEDGFDRITKQMEYDDGGLNAYSIGIFGTPGSEQFQWVLTGRHLTLRADGNTTKGSAFGGPIVYGHGEESSASDNLFYFQTKKVNEVFAALDSDQRKIALLESIPSESEVTPTTDAKDAQGLLVSAMSSDQQTLVHDVLKTILSPYRQEDGEEAFAIINEVGGVDQLRFAFYRDEDLEGDQVWDMWRIEGPRTVIHFRGAPHVHAFIHIG